mmetsp:Transcript_17394/g.51427  ORF Transcript_17394/g.51427 Transcript_17394/m.51427 type:complete len:214 (-) Transcript_17394:736-1377(-)
MSRTSTRRSRASTSRSPPRSRRRTKTGPGSSRRSCATTRRRTPTPCRTRTTRRSWSCRHRASAAWASPTGCNRANASWPCTPTRRPSTRRRSPRRPAGATWRSPSTTTKTTTKTTTLGGYCSEESRCATCCASGLRSRAVSSNAFVMPSRHRVDGRQWCHRTSGTGPAARGLPRHGAAEPAQKRFRRFGRAAAAQAQEAHEAQQSRVQHGRSN